MTQRTDAVRLLFGGAALAALTLTISACSDADSSPTTTVAGSSTVATTGPETTPTTTPATTVAPTPAPTVDPPSALSQALSALGGTYHFRSVVTVNGAESLVAEGDRIGDSSRLTLVGQGGTVAYIITPQGSYAQPADGDWELLEVPPATADPIVALAAPVGVTLASADGATTVVRVSVSAVSLGVPGDGNVDVDVAITGGSISQISYSSPVEGGVATVVTAVGPVADATPITPPI